MDYKPLGNTGLTVSVAGLGCGGNSRLGLGRGASVDECVAVVRTAIDLGVNFLDTAEAYGTEEIVGAAVRSYDRDKLVISTKALLGASGTAAEVTRRVEASLKRLGLDYVDIFHFHAVNPAAYEHHRDVLAPVLVRLKEQGKVRHVGITETGPNDPEQKMLTRAIQDDPWEVIMLAYSLMNQGARRKVFPTTQRRGIGTELLRRLVGMAVDAGCASVYAVTQASNTGMVAAMRGLGLPLDYQIEEGTLVITARLDGPLDEAVTERLSSAGELGKA